MGKKLTEEEKIERREFRVAKQKLKDELSAIRRKETEIKEKLLEAEILISTEPTYTFEIGERVQHGRIKKSIVKEIFGNGKVYVLDEIVTDHNYGRSYDYEREMVVIWTSIQKYRSEDEIKNTKRFLKKDDIIIHFSNMTISDGIIGKSHFFGVNKDPDYQRDLVWTEEDNISLIDSIFNNIDIGKFTFIKLPFKGRTSYSYEILDGKQRMNALLMFFEGRYKYKGKTFQELHPLDQSHISNYGVLIAEISENMTNKQKYNYFLKLNTGGRPQSKEHLNYVYNLYKDE